jgi:hypothetical protein
LGIGDWGLGIGDWGEKSDARAACGFGGLFSQATLSCVPFRHDDGRGWAVVDLLGTDRFSSPSGVSSSQRRQNVRPYVAPTGLGKTRRSPLQGFHPWLFTFRRSAAGTWVRARGAGIAMRLSPLRGGDVGTGKGCWDRDEAFGAPRQGRGWPASAEPPLGCAIRWTACFSLGYLEDRFQLGDGTKPRSS